MAISPSQVSEQLVGTPRIGVAMFAPERVEAELPGLFQRMGIVDDAQRQAGVGRYQWNEDRERLQFCCAEYAAIHDMSVEGILAARCSWKRVMAMIVREDRPAYAAAIQVMEDMGLLDIQYRIQLEDGTLKHVRECAIVLRDDFGTPGRIGLLMDVSEEVMKQTGLDFHDDFARQSEEITDIGHFVFDEVKETYIYVSEGFCRIHRASIDDFQSGVQSVEDDLADIVSEDRARVAEEYRYFIENNQAEGCALEYRIRRADGAIRWLRELSQAKEVKDGRVVKTLGVVQDITDRVEREQELVFKDSIARQAEEITHIGYFLYDLKHDRHLYMSSGFAHIAGLAVEDLRTRIESVEDYLELIHAPDRERARELYRSPRTSKGWEIEYRLRRPDGELRWVREVGKEYSRKHDTIEQIIGVIQDITVQKDTEEELRFKDAMANQAEAITEIGHFIYDEIHQKYLFVSPGFEKILGGVESSFMNRTPEAIGDIELVHPEDRALVREVYKKFLTQGDEWEVEYRIMQSDGEVRWIREIGKAYRIGHGIAEQTIGAIQDITAKKQAEQEIIGARDTLEQQVVERTLELANTVKQLELEIEEREKITAELQFLANHDALTGLPSLRLCKDRLNQSLADARRRRQTSAVMFLDLDGFKQINDRCGHEFGDRVLRKTAERITAEIRETDTVARIGGDEFVIILSSIPDNEIIKRIAASLVKAIAEPLCIDDIEVAVSASIGISLYPDNGVTAEELIRSADKAMYGVKREGKNGFGFVDSVPL